MHLGTKLNVGHQGQPSPLYFYVTGWSAGPVPVCLASAGQATNCKSVLLICPAVLE